MRLLRRKPKPEWRRHVALLPIGLGVTFSRWSEPRPGLSGRWTWQYDPELVGMQLNYAYTVNQATYLMDKLLGEVDEEMLRAGMGYGDDKVPDWLPGWPWEEFQAGRPLAETQT